MIASGAVTSTALAANAVLSATENQAPVNAGYVKIGTTATADAWQQRTNGTTPAARYNNELPVASPKF